MTIDPNTAPKYHRTHGGSAAASAPPTPLVTETMREEIARLRKALKPFAEYGEGYLGWYDTSIAASREDLDDDERRGLICDTLFAGDFQEAREAYLLHSTPVAGGEGLSDRASHPARIDGAPREAIATLERLAAERRRDAHRIPNGSYAKGQFTGEAAAYAHAATLLGAPEQRSAPFDRNAAIVAIHRKAP